MKMYEDAGKLSKEAMDNALKSYAAVTKGLQQITAETAEFTKRSYANQTAMIEKMFQARTLDKTMALQSDYAKSAYETWVAQMTKFGDIYSDIARQSYKPFGQTAASTSEKLTVVADKAALAAEDTVATAASKTASAAN